MHYYNGFELIIAFVLSMIPQLGGIVTKTQDLVIPLRLGEGEHLSDFHLRALAIKSELIFMINQTGQINNLTDKYITVKAETSTMIHEFL